MRQYSDELYHFGIKGMKWGVRKSRQQRAYERARRIVDRADRGKSPLMSLARKAGKALHKRGYVHPRTRKIMRKEQLKLEDSLENSKIKNDKTYKAALARSRKAARDYDRESAKWVSEGFPKSREKTLRSLGMEMANADGAYEKEWRRIKKEARTEAEAMVNKKYRHYA